MVPFESAWRGTPGDSYCGRAVVNARGSTHGFAVFTGLTSLDLVTTASRYGRELGGATEFAPHHNGDLWCRELPGASDLTAGAPGPCPRGPCRPASALAAPGWPSAQRAQSAKGLVGPDDSRGRYAQRPRLLRLLVVPRSFASASSGQSRQRAGGERRPAALLVLSGFVVRWTRAGGRLSARHPRRPRPDSARHMGRICSTAAWILGSPSAVRRGGSRRWKSGLVEVEERGEGGGQPGCDRIEVANE